MKKNLDLKPTRSPEVLSRYNANDFSFLLSLCANVRHYINFNPHSCFLFLCHNEKQLWASQECKSNFQRISGREIPYITKGHKKITHNFLNSYLLIGVNVSVSMFVCMGVNTVMDYRQVRVYPSSCLKHARKTTALLQWTVNLQLEITPTNNIPAGQRNFKQTV